MFLNSHIRLEKNKDIAIKKQTAFSNEFTTNGKKYREFSQNVMCCITKSSRSSLYSLVDMGSNGGVAGSDERIIDTHPNRKVDILGIDNHEINIIPLVTARGVISNITDEVIVIMHQCTCHGENKTINSSH